jgi:iron complex transport system ATP-binding protein
MDSSDRRRDDAGLAVAGLGFRYPGRLALGGIDLSVAPGEVVGVLGPNGSGKSTLVRILSGVLSGYLGSARLDGEEIAGLARRAMARKMAVVPQEPVFGFPFTALEVTLMGRHPHLAGLAFESDDDVRLARAALERCGAAELASRPIHELSSGERQRVVFAKALAQQPRVLLLDEPASFLDIRHQVALYDVVRDLAANDGCAVLTVLHDLNLAAEYCDRICLLRDGRVVASGVTAEVFTYANLTRVYDTEVYVDTNSLTGSLLVVPLPGRVQRRLRDG